MDTRNKKWPRVPSGSVIPSQGSSVGSDGSRGAKNLWEKSSCTKLKNTKLRIASYNARTLRSEDRLEELLYELDKIAWDVVGVSEVRRQGEESIKLHSGHILYYRGDDNTSHEHGVGLLIHKRLTDNIKCITSVSDRVIYVVLQITNRITIKVIQVYAPTGTALDLEVENFYEDISKSIHENKSTYTIVTGDLNAKVGADRDDTQTFIGKFGYGSRNSRGDMLVNFMEQEKLFHMSSFFEKRPARKWTWISPGGKHKNEIDYIFSSHKCIVQDVSVLNSFYTGSDHRIIRAIVRIDARLQRYAAVRPKNIKINTAQLNMSKDQYQQRLTKELSHISADCDQETIIQRVQNSLFSTARDLTSKSGKTRQKFQTETQDLLEERRTLLREGKRGTDYFKNLCKRTRKQVESDTEAYRERTVKQIIDKYRGPKVFHRALKSGTQQITKLLDKDGQLVIEQNNLLQVIQRYYEQLYSSHNPKPIDVVKRKVMNVGSEDVPEITTSEVEYALRKMKNGKSPGSDNIVIEMVKDGGDRVIELLRIAFNKCLDDQKIPEIWNCAVVILLYKKGNKADLNNYRPISLLSHLYKLFTKIITLRLTNKLDSYQPVEQAGFRSGYSTLDHILAMRIMVEKTTEYQMTLWLAFIDYKKAFDSVETWSVLESLQNARIDHRYCALVENMYKKATLRVNLPPVTEPVSIKKGVRQGDTLSPKLFTLVLEDILRSLHWEDYGISVLGRRLNNLRYADDIVLLASSPDELQHMMQELSDASNRCGLEMNLDKTKVMTNTESNATIKVDHAVIERVDKYVYLGQEIVTGKKNQTNEINRRVRLAWAAYSNLEFAFKMNLKAEQKARIFDQCILPVLTYGAETWVFTRDILHKLSVAQRAMERKLVGITLRDRKTNEWLRQRSKVTDVTKRVAKLKWEWAGHMARRADSWSKRLLEWRPWCEKRPRGRPQMRWDGDIQRTAGIKWLQIAQDRDVWRNLKEAYTRRVDTG